MTTRRDFIVSTAALAAAPLAPGAFARQPLEDVTYLLPALNELYTNEFVS